MEVLCSSRFDTPFGSLRVVSSEKGLVYVELPHASGRGFEGWKTTHARGAKVIDRRAAHDDMIDEILEYTAGERRTFTMDLDLRGTDFQLAVYKQVAKIGYGETRSYSDIAQAIGRPKAVRAVGAANGANPIPLVIPCHRVIARRGALQGYAGGLELKARLLAMESATFVPGSVPGSAPGSVPGSAPEIDPPKTASRRTGAARARSEAPGHVSEQVRLF